MKPSTKKELEARILALETEVAILRAERVAQQPIIIQPVAPYQQPYPYNPYAWPQITCDTTASISLTTDPGPVAVNY